MKEEREGGEGKRERENGLQDLGMYFVVEVVISDAESLGILTEGS